MNLTAVRAFLSGLLIGASVVMLGSVPRPAYAVLLLKYDHVKAVTGYDDTHDVIKTLPSKRVVVSTTEEPTP